MDIYITITISIFALALILFIIRKSLANKKRKEELRRARLEIPRGIAWEQHQDPPYKIHYDPFLVSSRDRISKPLPDESGIPNYWEKDDNHGKFIPDYYSKEQERSAGSGLGGGGGSSWGDHSSHDSHSSGEGFGGGGGGSWGDSGGSDSGGGDSGGSDGGGD